MLPLVGCPGPGERERERKRKLERKLKLSGGSFVRVDKFNAYTHRLGFLCLAS